MVIELKSAKTHAFLVADTQLYKRLCPSVGPSVRRSVTHESKIGKQALKMLFLVCVLVVGAWGVAEGWMPLPTRPQRYCDPASLVLNFKRFLHYGPCPTVHDCLAMYPALFSIVFLNTMKHYRKCFCYFFSHFDINFHLCCIYK